jgi:hypothetical protein
VERQALRHVARIVEVKVAVKASLSGMAPVFLRTVERENLLFLNKAHTLLS